MEELLAFTLSEVEVLPARVAESLDEIEWFAFDDFVVAAPLLGPGLGDQDLPGVEVIHPPNRLHSSLIDWDCVVDHHYLKTSFEVHHQHVLPTILPVLSQEKTLVVLLLVVGKLTEEGGHVVRVGRLTDRVLCVK